MSMLDTPDVVLIQLDTTMTEEERQEMFGEVRHIHVIDMTKQMGEVEQYLLPELERRRPRHRIKLRAWRAIDRIIRQSIQLIDPKSRLVVAAPYYMDRDQVGAAICMITSQPVQVVSRG